MTGHHYHQGPLIWGIEYTIAATVGDGGATFLNAAEAAMRYTNGIRRDQRADSIQQHTSSNGTSRTLGWYETSQQ
jgi:hypothetical protein